MHASIAPVAIVTTTTRRRRTITHKMKMGSLTAPQFSNCCVVSEAMLTARVLSGDAHRESGVFSFGSALSPVESCSLQNSMSSGTDLLL
jgi:hypothetical protein